MTIYSGESFGLLNEFFDIYGNPQTPDELIYSIIRLSDDSIIKTETLTPTGTSYVIPISSSTNTIDGLSEERKIVVKWTYNDGTDGDVEVYFYNIEQP